MFHLDVQHGRLQAVQPAVDPFHHVIALAAVAGKGRHPVGQLVVVGHDAAGIAVSPQVLARVEGEGGRMPNVPTSWPL